MTSMTCPPRLRVLTGSLPDRQSHVPILGPVEVLDSRLRRGLRLEHHHPEVGLELALDHLALPHEHGVELGLTHRAREVLHSHFVTLIPGLGPRLVLTAQSVPHSPAPASVAAATEHAVTNVVTRTVTKIV